jgi:hypothetical protein
MFRFEKGFLFTFLLLTTITTTQHGGVVYGAPKIDNPGQNKKQETTTTTTTITTATTTTTAASNAGFNLGGGNGGGNGNSAAAKAAAGPPAAAGKVPDEVLDDQTVTCTIMKRDMMLMPPVRPDGTPGELTVEQQKFLEERHKEYFCVDEGDMEYILDNDYDWMNTVQNDIGLGQPINVGETTIQFQRVKVIKKPKNRVNPNDIISVVPGSKARFVPGVSYGRFKEGRSQKDRELRAGTGILTCVDCKVLSVIVQDTAGVKNTWIANRPGYVGSPELFIDAVLFSKTNVNNVGSEPSVKTQFHQCSGGQYEINPANVPCQNHGVITATISGTWASLRTNFCNVASGQTAVMNAVDVAVANAMAAKGLTSSMCK